VPSVARIGRVERDEVLEDTVEVHLRDPDARVRDPELVALWPTRSDREIDVTAFREFQGVAEKVKQDLLETHFVTQNGGGKVFGEPQLKRIAAGLCDTVQAFDSGAQKYSQSEGLVRQGHLAGVDSGDVENVPHMTQKERARSPHDPQVLALGGGERRVLQ
jgi:hypothetical protein